MRTIPKSLALLTVYHGGGQSFPVLPSDAVYGSDGRIVGYSHSRAWRAALAAACRQLA